MNLFINERSQYLAFAYLSLAVAGMTGVLYAMDASPFQRFIGALNPLLAVFISIVAGFFLLTYLISRTQFAIYKKQDVRSDLIVVGLARLFGIEVIAADTWLVDYAADINILFPQSLLFYPVIGYIVEVFFHLLPLSVIILLLSPFRKLDPQKKVWVAIIAVAILEPLYQMWFTSGNSSLTTLYTGVHVFLFSLTQLLIFKRFDFISMYLFRLVFYAIWHVVWGHFRLELLF